MAASLPPGKSVRPQEPANRVSPENMASSISRHTEPGGMAGGADNGNRQPREVQGIPPRRRFWYSRAAPPSSGAAWSARRRRDRRRSRSRRRSPYAAHMVKMSVGQQDRFHGQPQSLPPRSAPFPGGVAGVDDTAGLRRTVVDDVAVGSVSPKGQRVNVQHTITYRVILSFSSGRIHQLLRVQNQSHGAVVNGLPPSCPRRSGRAEGDTPDWRSRQGTAHTAAPPVPGSRRR